MTVRSYYWEDMGNGNELSTIMGMLFLDSILYGLLALYLDNVIPKEFGVRKGLFYPITDTIKFIQQLLGKEIHNAAKNILQDVANNSLQPIAGEDGDVYEEMNEVFGLLGPNGAGKTTIISMLTGMFSPSSGIVIVNNFNVYDEMQEIYESIGVCPQ